MAKVEISISPGARLIALGVRLIALGARLISLAVRRLVFGDLFELVRRSSNFYIPDKKRHF